MFMSAQEVDAPNCSICLCDLSINIINNITLPCNHTFHRNCFDQWRSYQDSCPYCRYRLNQDIIPTVLYDELIAPDGNIDALNETNYRHFYRLNENVFTLSKVLEYISNIRNAKIIKDSLRLAEQYRITGDNTIVTGQLIKICQITYYGNFACHFIVNGREKVFFSNLHQFQHKPSVNLILSSY